MDRRLPRPLAIALGSALSCAPLAARCEGDPDGGSDYREQRGPEVSEGRHDSSPPLRDIPPAPRQTGHRVHEVKPIPRPHPPPPAAEPPPPKDPP